MKPYLLEAIGEGREVYHVEAASEDEARELFEQGLAGSPEISEISGVEIVHIEEDGEETS